MYNNVVPTYYGRFREKVLRGEIPVCKEISLEMNRIDALIADPDIYYDPRPIEGLIAYVEAEATLTDGDDVKMLDTFKVWFEQLLCWYYFEDAKVYIPGKNGKRGRMGFKKVRKRLVNKQYLIVARGAAKSMYASFLHSYILNIVTKTTHQVAVAPTMKQGEEVISPIRTSIARSRGPLFKFLTQGSIHATKGSNFRRQILASTKKGIENTSTGSLIEIRPMSVNKLQGLRPFLSTVDEWLSGDTREDVVGALEQGASKLDNWIILAISSEGTIRSGVGDTMKLELSSILHGEYVNPHVSIFHYKLDDVSEVANPDMWEKAQPNIGITVSYETYARDVERAENSPSSRNDILAKRFGLPMEGFTFYFTYEETLRKRPRNYDGMLCALGADLSQGDDFCSFTFLFPLRNGSFGMKVLSFISETTLNKLPSAMRFKYDEFISEGSLVVLPGVVLDIGGEVYESVLSYTEEHKFEVACLGYDPYNAEEFLAQWISEHGEYGIVKVRQGSRTESVPLGEIKNLSLEGLWLFDQKSMEFAMGNAMVMEDTNGNRKLFKRRHEAKIDPVAAAMDAFIAYKLNREMFE